MYSSIAIWRLMRLFRRAFIFLFSSDLQNCFCKNLLVWRPTSSSKIWNTDFLCIFYQHFVVIYIFSSIPCLNKCKLALWGQWNADTQSFIVFFYIFLLLIVLVCAILWTYSTSDHQLHQKVKHRLTCFNLGRSEHQVMVDGLLLNYEVAGAGDKVAFCLPGALGMHRPICIYLFVLSVCIYLFVSTVLVVGPCQLSTPLRKTVCTTLHLRQVPFLSFMLCPLSCLLPSISIK